jgi:GTPase
MISPAPVSLPLVAIVGRANVGKSTLFNRLTRSAQALVADIPGVTRDRHYGTVTADDHTFLLVDTGGLGGSDDELEAMVRRQAEVAVAEADVIVLVLDGREGLLPADAEVVDFLRRAAKPLVVVVNKVDHPSMEPQLADFYRLGLSPLLAVSAVHGQGMGALLDEIIALLPPPLEYTEAPGAIRLAVVGRPNVGKSSFINYFLGEERLLVSPQPGTTRDAVDTPLTMEGTDFILVDTAGMRRPSQVAAGLERQMVLKTIKALIRADVAVLLLDASEGLTGQDLRIAALIADQGKGCLILLNKFDLVREDPVQSKAILAQVTDGLEIMAYAPVLPASVLTGYNLRRAFPLLRAIHEQSTRRLGTGELNRILKDITDRTPPPRYRGRPIKFYYLTQPETQPPVFVAFVNYPQGVPDSYRRYVVKQLRERLHLPYASLRLFLRARKRRD